MLGKTGQILVINGYSMRMNYHSLSKASHAHAEVGRHGRAPVEDVDAVVADGEAQGVVEGGGVEEGGLLKFNKF